MDLVPFNLAEVKILVIRLASIAEVYWCNNNNKNNNIVTVMVIIFMIITTIIYLFKTTDYILKHER